MPARARGRGWRPRQPEHTGQTLILVFRRSRAGQLRVGGVHLDQGGPLELWREARLAAVGPSPGARCGPGRRARACRRIKSEAICFLWLCSHLPQRNVRGKGRRNNMYHIGVKFATADCVLVPSSITRCISAVMLYYQSVQSSPGLCRRRLLGARSRYDNVTTLCSTQTAAAARDGLDRRCMFGTSELAQCTALVDLG